MTDRPQVLALTDLIVRRATMLAREVAAPDGEAHVAEFLATELGLDVGRLVEEFKASRHEHGDAGCECDDCYADDLEQALRENGGIVTAPAPERAH